MPEQSDRAQSASAHAVTRELLLKARKYHRLRFWRQFGFWSVVIGAAAACYPLESWLLGAHGSCTSLAACSMDAYQIANAAPVPVLAIFLIFHLWRDYQAGIDWRDALKSIGSLAKHEVVTQGFADFFDIYIRSKRRSYHLISVGLLSLVYALVGGWLALRLGAATGFYMIVVMAEFLLGLILLIVSYRISRGYLPGQIVAENTLLLCTIALQKDISIAAAREIVEKDVQQFINQKPWWFYN